MIVLKDGAIAVKAPPLTELAVPGARQRVEELRKVKGRESVKVLVAEMASEVILSRQMTDNGLAEQRVVETASAHPPQVEQQYARVVARKSA